MIAGTGFFMLVMGYVVFNIGVLAKSDEEKGSRLWKSGIKIGGIGLVMMILGVLLFTISLSFRIAEYMP